MEDVEVGDAPPLLGPETDPNQSITEEILEPYKLKNGRYAVVRTYFDLAVDKEPLGRVEIDLKNINKLPKTSANFLALCEGTRENVKGKTMHYKGTAMFRMVPNFCMCGGDTVNNNGTTGSSVLSETLFKDEKCGLNHDKPGIVSMLQQAGGPNTNGSQFVILLTPAPWLDKTNVPFGVVSSGFDVVDRVCDKYGADSGVPSKTVRIFDCGLK